jgi:hypothetical protein
MSKSSNSNQHQQTNNSSGFHNNIAARPFRHQHDMSKLLNCAIDEDDKDFVVNVLSDDEGLQRIKTILSETFTLDAGRSVRFDNIL